MTAPTPLLTKDDWHLRHEDGALLLRRAHFTVAGGLPGLARRLLKAPLTAAWDFEDRGTQFSIDLDAPDVPSIGVWCGQEGRALSCERDARWETFGFNPEVPFAHDSALTFLLACQDELLAANARDERMTREKLDREAVKRTEAIAAYRALMTGA